MKFTKTAVAVAIAGIAAAPMIVSADTTLSGIVEVNVNGSDVDGDDGDARVGTGDVLFGIVSEHEMDNGLTGYGSLRLDLDGLSNQRDDTGEKVSPSYDSVYTGIKGGFGDFRIGEIPLSIEYGQVANDIFDIGDEINGGLSYTGTFGPVGIIANFSPEQNFDGNQVGLGAKFNLGGFGIGIGAEQRGENDDMNASIGATFAIAGASIAAHFASLEADDANDGSDVEVIAVQAGYGFGGVSAKVTFTTRTGENDASEDQEAVRLDLLYAMGGGVDLSTRITSTTDNLADEDLVEWRIQLAKSF